MARQQYWAVRNRNDELINDCGGNILMQKTEIIENVTRISNCTNCNSNPRSLHPMTSTTDENPTHFIALNNSTTTPPQAHRCGIKLIKVKVIVPKGTLNKSKFDHKVNVLNEMNDFDKTISNNHDKEDNDIIKLDSLKITNLLSSGSVRIKDAPKPVYPLMGRNALKSRSSVVSDSFESDDKVAVDVDRPSDSAIVQELVTERYQDFMADYQQRNYRRQSSRRSSNSGCDTNKADTILLQHQFSDLSTADSDVTNYASTSNISFTSHIKHNSTEASQQQDDILQQLQLESSINNKDSESPPQVDDESFTDYVLRHGGSLNLGSALEFILSTDGTNKESTADDSAHSEESMISSGFATDSGRSKSEQYDHVNFLQQALGDDQRSYVSADTGRPATNGSSSTDDGDSSNIDNEDAREVNSSIGTSDISALISKSSLYSNIPERYRRVDQKLSSDVISEETLLSDQVINDSQCSVLSDQLASLIQESITQYQIMIQTSKALQVCNGMKEFAGSVELVEAERMLLIATCRRQAVLEEVKRLEYQDPANDPMLDNPNRGQVTITALHFFARQSSPTPKSQQVHHATSPLRRPAHTQWFICLLTYKGHTYATEATVAHCINDDKDGIITFQETFHFSDLDTDFEIIVALYSLSVRNSLRNYSHESKFRLNHKDGKKRFCPGAPRKFFQNLANGGKDRASHSPTSPSSSSSAQPSPQQSSFELCGRTTLRLSHFASITAPCGASPPQPAAPFRLSTVSAVVPVSGLFTVQATCSVRVRETRSGFLTIGSERNADGRMCWNRHWSALRGTTLEYWNYPTDEGVTTPLGSIDLSCCVTAEITQVDRNICARPRTLLVETTACQNLNQTQDLLVQRKRYSQFSYRIVRHFLSCDTAVDMRHWQHKLNAVVSSLRSWNAMTAQLHFRPE